MKLQQVGFGGGCHWCTEAVFLSLKGVYGVKQGWISSIGGYLSYSEAVLLNFDSKIITIHDLVTIHLHTHSCTSDHNMRSKYRSAIYYTSEEQEREIKSSLLQCQSSFQKPIVTLALPFRAFKLSKKEQLNYYYSDPTKQFCTRYIDPKLILINKRFTHLFNKNAGEM